MASARERAFFAASQARRLPSAEPAGLGAASPAPAPPRRGLFRRTTLTGRREGLNQDRSVYALSQNRGRLENHTAPPAEWVQTSRSWGCDPRVEISGERWATRRWQRKSDRGFAASQGSSRYFLEVPSSTMAAASARERARPPRKPHHTNARARNGFSRSSPDVFFLQTESQKLTSAFTPSPWSPVHSCRPHRQPKNAKRRRMMTEASQNARSGKQCLEMSRCKIAPFSVNS